MNAYNKAVSEISNSNNNFYIKYIGLRQIKLIILPESASWGLKTFLCLSLKSVLSITVKDRDNYTIKVLRIM